MTRQYITIPMPLRVSIDRDHGGRWYATAEDFGVSGAGPSEGAAVENLARILDAYLSDFYDRRLPFEASLQSNAQGDDGE